MADKYPDKIKTLPRYNGRFDAYKLKAQGCDVHSHLTQPKNPFRPIPMTPIIMAWLLEAS